MACSILAHRLPCTQPTDLRDQATFDVLSQRAPRALSGAHVRRHPQMLRASAPHLGAIPARIVHIWAPQSPTKDTTTFAVTFTRKPGDRFTPMEVAGMFGALLESQTGK